MSDPERFDSEALESLERTERFLVRVADFFVRYLGALVTLWRHTVVALVALITIAPRMKPHGLQHLRGIEPDDRVIVVANHRTLFDFFAITGATAWYTRLPRRGLFPVRSTFFYERLLGGLVNLLLSGMSMFPPIMRDTSKKHFNKQALRRVRAELERPGTMIGVHPEGTRNTGDDPYEYLPAQPGIGKIILDSPPETIIVPVFVLGLTNSVIDEFKNSWFRPRRHNPIHVVFGPPVDIGDFREQGSRPATQKRTADRCLEAIAALGREEYALRNSTTSSEDSEAPPASGSPGRPEALGRRGSVRSAEGS